MLKLILRGFAVFLWLLAGAALLFVLMPRFPGVDQRPELATGLIGGAVAITAAWLAWDAVQRQIASGSVDTDRQLAAMRQQITADDDRAEKLRRSGLAGAAVAMATQLRITASQMTATDPLIAFSTDGLSQARELIPTLASAHAGLAEAAAGYIAECVGFDQSRREMARIFESGESPARGMQFRDNLARSTPLFAARCKVLALRCDQVRQTIEQYEGGYVLPSREDIEKTTGHPYDRSKLGWAVIGMGSF